MTALTMFNEITGKKRKKEFFEDELLLMLSSLK